MPGMRDFSEMLAFLEEKCPDAYIELYSYDVESKTAGTLLKRWSLKDNIQGHHYFSVYSQEESSIITYEAYLGYYTFTILPEDIALTSEMKVP